MHIESTTGSCWQTIFFIASWRSNTIISRYFARRLLSGGSKVLYFAALTRKQFRIVAFSEPWKFWSLAIWHRIPDIWHLTCSKFESQRQGRNKVQPDLAKQAKQVHMSCPASFFAYQLQGVQYVDHTITFLAVFGSRKFINWPRFSRKIPDFLKNALISRNYQGSPAIPAKSREIFG